MIEEYGAEKEFNLIYREYINNGRSFHFHPQTELCFVTEGEMEICVGDSCRKLSQGEMAAVFGYEMHYYKTPVKSTSRILVIPDCFGRELIKIAGEKRVTNPFITDKKTAEKISALAAEINKTDNELKKKGYLYVILGMLADHIFSESEDEENQGIFCEILRYINRNFKEDISGETVADYFGYNPGYISKYFKEYFGMGMSRYLNLLRVRNAIMLMLEKKHTCIYCAKESGFNSMRTFYRVFNNELGCPLGDYMKGL